MDLGQGDYQLSGTDRILTDIAMVPPILMAGIKSFGYKSKRSDRTLTGAALEMEILSQCGESKMEGLQAISHESWKGKCCSTTNTSGIQPTNRVGGQCR